MSHNDIMFTLETQMGKTNYNGYSILILRIFGYNVTHGSLCILSSLAKMPLRVVSQGWIGDLGGNGKAKRLTF